MGCRISQRMSWQSQSRLTLWQLQQALDTHRKKIGNYYTLKEMDSMRIYNQVTGAGFRDGMKKEKMEGSDRLSQGCLLGWMSKKQYSGY